MSEERGIIECKMCAYWDKQPSLNGAGFCQRHPPVVFMVDPSKGGTMSAFPVVGQIPGQGCGDGKIKILMS